MLSGFTTHYLCCYVNTSSISFLHSLIILACHSLFFSPYAEVPQSNSLASVFLDFFNFNHLFLNPSSATFSYGYTSDHVKHQKSYTWKPFLQFYSASPLYFHFTYCGIQTIDSTESCNPVTLLYLFTIHHPLHFFLSFFLTCWGSTTQHKNHSLGKTLDPPPFLCHISQEKKHSLY